MDRQGGKLDGAVKLVMVEVGEGVVDELNDGEDGLGDGGGGGFGVLTARWLWIQPSATGFYEPSISDGSEGSSTKCHDLEVTGRCCRRIRTAPPPLKQKAQGGRRVGKFRFTLRCPPILPHSEF